ncbi:MAG: VIT and VWA domain-containing protein [Pseudomonadota bacterium]
MRTHHARALTILAVAVLPMALTAVSAPAATAQQPREAGELLGMIGDETVSLPMVRSDYEVAIDGTLAAVKVTQTFLNTHDQPLNATYLFPLNRKAAIHAMTMEIGDEVVDAVIQRKTEARQTFEAAKADGKAAALLDQHRPNMFTQDVANLMPGMPLTITLRYVQTVPKVEGAYELVVPMVVGPRYESGVAVAPTTEAGDNPMGDLLHDPDRPEQISDETAGSSPKARPLSGWTVAPLVDYPPVHGLDAPDAIDPNRVGFALKLRAAVPVLGLTSATHTLAVETTQDGATATLANGRAIGNRDLVVRYELGSDASVTAGVLSHRDERGGFLALQIEPPRLPAEDAITPRELVFVLDTSGSMSGQPMAASKTFMRAALSGLRAGDHFRILRFSNSTSQFAQQPVAASQQNIRAGINYVNGLSAGGGTEMNQAINAAFDLPPLADTLRIVVFLTDGYIGADREVIQTVAKRIGDARIHAFGVGSAVNRYLLEGLAEEGRGKARMIGVDENAREAAEALARSLDAPLLTDIVIDWNGLKVTGQSPARLPDLFEGGSVTVLGRYTSSGNHRIEITGKVNGRPASMPIDLALASTADADTGDNPALPVVWARQRIFDLERDYTIAGGQDERTREAITTLGLDFSLQTAFTSFVATSRTVLNADPSSTADAAVPLPQVHGTTAAAYPHLQLGGSSTPEPEALLGLLAALLLAMVRFRRAVAFRLRTLTYPPMVKRPRIPGLPKRVLNDGWWLE